MKKVCLLVVEDRDYILQEYMWQVIELMSRGKVARVFRYKGNHKPIWHIRDELIKKALETDCTHILFIDTDVLIPDNFVKTLLSHKKDIVAGTYYDLDRKPMVYKDLKRYQGKGLEEVDLCCIGASLIERKVLEKVSYSRPQNNKAIDGDVDFCVKVKEAGFKIYQDFDLKCDHIKLVRL